MATKQQGENPFWARFRDPVPMKDLIALNWLPGTVAMLGDPSKGMDEILPTFPPEFYTEHPSLMTSLGAVATMPSSEILLLAS